ncbi:hypothetical protein ACSVBT_18055 [Afipia sp. TerB]
MASTAIITTMAGAIMIIAAGGPFTSNVVTMATVIATTIITAARPL